MNVQQVLFLFTNISGGVAVAFLFYRATRYKGPRYYKKVS